jgi:predicted site-specific integrase-resolvase
MARTNKRKKAILLEALAEAPLTEMACKRAGISRATYYRWYKEDKEFARAAQEAILLGDDRINNLAESKLVGLINKEDLRAIQFWLRNRSGRFKFPKIVTAEQEVVIQEPRVITVFPMRIDEKTKNEEDND